MRRMQLRLKQNLRRAKKQHSCRSRWLFVFTNSFKTVLFQRVRCGGLEATRAGVGAVRSGLCGF